MNDREKWRERVRDIRAGGTTWWWYMKENGKTTISMCLSSLASHRWQFKMCDVFLLLPVFLNCLISLYRNIDGALRSANGTEYGLASGVFTKDINKALNVADQLVAGTVFVNTYNKTDVAAPFGGFKQSGFGKDLGKLKNQTFSFFLFFLFVIISLVTPGIDDCRGTTDVSLVITHHLSWVWYHVYLG